MRRSPPRTRTTRSPPEIPAQADGYATLFGDLQAKGFARVRVDGIVYPLGEAPELDGQDPHTIEVVVDRLTVKASSRQRLTDSVETALRLAGGRMIAEFIDRPDDDPGRERRYSEHLSCPNGHPQTLDDIEPRSFSFNSPLGACPVCSGLGTRREIDPDLVVPDGKLPLAKGAIAPWAGWKDREYFGRLLRGAAAGTGLQRGHPVGRTAGRGTGRGTERHRRPGARQLPDPGRARPVVPRPV